MEEVKQRKRTRSKHGYITTLGAVCYTSEGAFYVPFKEGEYCLNNIDDIHMFKGVYSLEKGGFVSQYNEYILDRHVGFGDIYDETFVSSYVDDIRIQKIVDIYLIYSFDAVARIVQRCIN